MVQLLALAGLVSAAAATAHLLLTYRSSSAAVGWLFAFWVFPVVGAAVYAAFVTQRVPRSVRRKRKRAASLRRRAPPSEEDRPRPPAELDPGLYRLSRAVGTFPLVPGNSLEIPETSDAAFDAMLEEIAGAEVEVGLSTYILRDDRLGRALSEVLLDRAANGVAVRLVYDPIGCVRLPGTYVERLRKAGIAATGFLSPSVLERRFQLNFRNHRKILVVDGRAAFTGGLNWGDEYSESRGGEDARRDLQVRLSGPAVAGLRRVFLEDWCLATGDELPPDIDPPAEVGDTAVRVVPHGPDEEDQDRLPSLLAGAIGLARERVLLATPYFVPGEDMLGALRLAALRGTRVTLLLPRRSDIAVADHAARRRFDRLLEAGVDLRLCRGGMLHAKALLVDDVWSTVGSANYDQRSFQYNYELNLEVCGGAFSSSLTQHLEPWIEEATSTDLEEHRRRPHWRRALENAANLFEPLL